MGVVISDNAILNVLAYADDLVLLASNPDDLQLLLSVVHNWCQNWRVAVNISKLFQIITKTRMNFDSGHNSLSKLFQSCVVPVLDYGIAAWNTGKSSKYRRADQVQERAIRYYCGLPQMTPILGMEGKMGWLPGMVRRDMECLRLYNQLIKMPDSSIAKTVMM